MLAPNPNVYRVPCKGDKVRLQGLVSASQWNGQQGIVQRHVVEQDRYQVRVVSRDNNKKTLAVKRENLELLQDPTSRVVPMHVFIPCHLSNHELCLKRFGQCLKSVGKQTQRGFCVFVGISSPYLGMQSIAEGLVRVSCDKRPGIHWYVVNNNDETKSQFEHFRDLLSVSDAVNRNAWLLFLDNDDMFHPERVGLFWAWSQHQEDKGEVVFNCGSKMLLDSDIAGNCELELDKLVIRNNNAVVEPWKRDSDLLQVVTIALGDDISKLDCTEFFDFCVKASLLRRFIELTPSELLANKFCDCRFMASIARYCTSGYNYPNWLMAHYKLTIDSKADAFNEDDVERHERHASANAESSTIKNDEEDMQLAEQTGLARERIALSRNEIEEQVIIFCARDQGNLARSRERFVNELNKNCGHNLGTILWNQTCKKFATYFSDQLEQDNIQWCNEGSAPHALMDFNEYRDELY